jgi:hypothetical protein
LLEFGYEQGRNLALDARWAEGRAERLGPLAAALAAEKVDVIVTAGAAATLAAQQATSTIPIVFTGGGDQVVGVPDWPHPLRNCSGGEQVGNFRFPGKLDRSSRAAIQVLPRHGNLLSPGLDLGCSYASN